VVAENRIAQNAMATMKILVLDPIILGGLNVDCRLMSSKKSVMV
jgi:hypothetical protein